MGVEATVTEDRMIARAISRDITLLVFVLLIITPKNKDGAKAPSYIVLPN